MTRSRRDAAIENHLLPEGLATQPVGDHVDRIAAAFRQLSSPELALLHRYETRLYLIYQRAPHNLLLLRTPGVRNEPNPISGHPGLLPRPASRTPSLRVPSPRHLVRHCCRYPAT